MQKMLSEIVGSCKQRWPFFRMEAE